MTDSLTNPTYKSWMMCARAMWAEGGVRVSSPAVLRRRETGPDLFSPPQAFYHGFTPAILRAFPTVCAFPPILTSSSSERREH